MSVLDILRPGRRLLRYKQVFGNGWRAAYYQRVVGRRILNTPPAAGTVDPWCEVHEATSARHWLNLVWTLKTFYHQAGRRYTLCIHEDGTVPATGLDALRRHFPDARVVTRAEGDAAAAPLQADRPRSRAFRDTNPIALKVFNPIALRQRMPLERVEDRDSGGGRGPTASPSSGRGWMIHVPGSGRRWVANTPATGHWPYRTRRRRGSAGPLSAAAENGDQLGREAVPTGRPGQSYLVVG